MNLQEVIDDIESAGRSLDGEWGKAPDEPGALSHVVAFLRDSLDAAWAEAEAARKAMPDPDWTFTLTSDGIATATNARPRKRGSRMVQVGPLAPAAALRALAAKLREVK